MKESILRTMIRKQIKSSINEAPIARSAVSSKLGRVEKMAGVKMLKKALGQGTPQQQAAGLLKVIQVISGGNPQTGKMLARMLMKGGIVAPEAPAPAPAPEPVPEGRSSALASRMARVDKTQAMVQMKKMLATKPATQQTDFVLDLLKGLDLKGSAKQRLFQKMRRELGGKLEKE